MGMNHAGVTCSMASWTRAVHDEMMRRRDELQCRAYDPDPVGNRHAPLDVDHAQDRQNLGDQRGGADLDKVPKLVTDRSEVSKGLARVDQRDEHKQRDGDGYQSRGHSGRERPGKLLDREHEVGHPEGNREVRDVGVSQSKLSVRSHCDRTLCHRPHVASRPVPRILSSLSPSRSSVEGLRTRRAEISLQSEACQKSPWEGCA